MYFAPNVAIDEQYIGCYVKANSETEFITITYKANGGTGDDKQVKVIKGTKVAASSNEFTAPETKKFGSWNTEAAGTGTSYNEGAEIQCDNDMDLYAIWVDESTPEPEPKEVTVIYDTNGGTGSQPEAMKTTQGGKITTAVGTTMIPPTDKRFDHWNTQADDKGVTYNANTEITVDADMTLYAIWVDDMVTISFDPNGGTGSVEAIKCLRNHEQNVPASDGMTAPEGEEFVEWNTTNEGNGTSYDPGSKITPEEDTTLYAIWIKSDEPQP